MCCGRGKDKGSRHRDDNLCVSVLMSCHRYGHDGRKGCAVEGIRRTKGQDRDDNLTVSVLMLRHRYGHDGREGCAVEGVRRTKGQDTDMTTYLCW